jgi:protease I
MSKNILIITGDGGESYEAWYAYHRFLEAGDKPTVAAPTQRRMHLVMHDFEEGWDTYIERQGYGMEAQMAIADAKEADFDAILILGGRAPEYLRHNQTLLDLVRQFHSKQKWVFAICHGTQVLINAGLAQGNCLTCYEHVRSEVERNGGTYATTEAVRDKNIVTAQTWQSHPEFYRLVFECLKEGELPY